MPRFVHNDDSVFFTVRGEGPAVLMLHGWCCDGSDWAWLATDLARDHLVIVPDHIGHGRSSQTPGDYSPTRMASDAAAILTSLSVESAVVVGHSMGTIIASTLEATRPELVRALVLIDPVYGQLDEFLAPLLQGVAADPTATAQAIFDSFYVEATPSWLPFWHSRRIEGTPDPVIARAFQGLYQGETAYGRRALGEKMFGDRQSPTLSIYAPSGSAVAEWEREMLGATPHDETLVWEDAGHFLHQEFPDRTARTVREWLGGIPEQVSPAS